ncbi:hypothetical protein JCM19233_5545 [Vibrio astriarenae]|nr:hypothetical protein JCM19233_5545 [Vibrio sp. C7]
MKIDFFSLLDDLSLEQLRDLKARIDHIIKDDEKSSFTLSEAERKYISSLYKETVD